MGKNLKKGEKYNCPLFINHHHVHSVVFSLINLLFDQNVCFLDENWPKTSHQPRFKLDYSQIDSSWDTVQVAGRQQKRRQIPAENPAICSPAINNANMKSIEHQAQKTYKHSDNVEEGFAKIPENGKAARTTSA